MLRFTVTVVLVALTAFTGYAQTSPTPAKAPPATTVAAPPAAALVIPVQLSKSLDSKKLKPGDEVDATTFAEMRSSNGSVIPSGSRVVGRITQSTARANGNPDSTLAFTFDKIILKDGREFPLKASLQALAPPNPTPSAGMQARVTPSSTGMSVNQGRSQADAWGNPSNVIGAPIPDSNLGSPRQRGPSGLTGESTGVIGIHDLEMGQDSILKSTGKNVKLEPGSLMVLRVQ